MTPVGYLIETAAAVPPDDAWLTAAERRTLETLRVAKRRADWRLGRRALKRAVALALDRPELAAALGRIEVRTAASGAPTVYVDDRAAPCAVSLSHAGGAAFCVVAPPRTSIGCDLERIEPRDEAFVTTFFAASERRLVAATTGAARDRLVTLCWSAKESAAKAVEEGLRLDVRDLVVDVDPASLTGDTAGGSPWSPLGVRMSAQRFSGWWCCAPAGLLVVVGIPDLAPPRPLG